MQMIYITSKNAYHVYKFVVLTGYTLAYSLSIVGYIRSYLEGPEHRRNSREVQLGYNMDLVLLLNHLLTTSWDWAAKTITRKCFAIPEI